MATTVPGHLLNAHGEMPSRLFPSKHWRSLFGEVAEAVESGEGLGGGGTTALFTDATERDQYYIDNPDQLKKGVSVVVGDPPVAYTYDGANWLPGVIAAKGEKGDKGDPGVDGVDGAPGATGATGPMGPAGPQGEKGDKGDKGDTGDASNYTETDPVFSTWQTAEYDVFKAATNTALSTLDADIDAVDAKIVAEPANDGKLYARTYDSTTTSYIWKEVDPDAVGNPDYANLAANRLNTANELLKGGTTYTCDFNGYLQIVILQNGDGGSGANLEVDINSALVKAFMISPDVNSMMDVDLLRVAIGDVVTVIKSPIDNTSVIECYKCAMKKVVL